MTIGRDLEHRLDSWMQEDAALPDDLREVLAKLSETPQRRHRWSLSFADVTWRTRNMFSATRVAALVAIMTIGGSFAIYSGALAPATDQAVVPSVEIPSAEDPAQMMAPARIEGTFLWGLDGDNNGEEVGAFLRGRIGRIWAIESADPRIDGTGRVVVDARDDGGLGPEWGTFRLETEEGAWQGTMSGFWDRHETRTSGWLRGDGGYAGLTMYLETVIDHAGAPAKLVGVIVPGDPPSDPPTFD